MFPISLGGVMGTEAALGSVGDGGTRVEIAAPLRLWSGVLADPARFKLLRWGRRASKTRLDLHMALFGHGSIDGVTGAPERRGLVHGVDVVWIGPDYPQLEAIWLEEIRPRFDGRSGFRLNEGSKSLTMAGGGTLWLVSYENVAKVRGRGKLLGGAILDECAHYDLEYAWRSIVRPALMDTGGWAVFSSTTNSGPDGAVTEAGQKRAPSYFNTLCLQVMGGMRPATWSHSHADARQNETINPAEFVELVGEYDAFSTVALREEVYAELLQDGAGLAFPSWRESYHVKAVEPDVDASCAGGMDWGHGTPGWFGLVYTQPGDRLLLRKEWYYKGVKAKRVGYEVGKMCLESPVPVQWIALDSACFSVTGVGATIAEKLQEGLEVAYQRCAENDEWRSRVVPEVLRVCPAFVSAPKGHQAIQTQKVLIHEVLDWEADADGVVVDAPVLTVHPECQHFRRTVAALREDPVDRNKFSTRGEDHAVQGFAYYLVMRAPEHRSRAPMRVLASSRAHLDGLSLREAESSDRMSQRAEREYRAVLAKVQRMGRTG